MLVSISKNKVYLALFDEKGLSNGKRSACTENWCLATANLYWTRFGATNKAIYRTKKPCWFFNHLRFFSLSMSLFARSKFANNLLTHNRRGDFNWKRRRNIRIFQVFIDWKAPAIMCYRRVQYRLAVATLLNGKWF